jgi:predicted 3-demethylubiquinone-9 3-methyltransferase (glyoxalase superfamily)
VLASLLQNGNTATSERVMNALLAMKKLDIAALQRAHDQP